MVALDADFPDALPAKTPLQGGNYVVEGVLGQGGAGITYLCTDAGLRRAVAIKEFFPLGCVRVGMHVQPGGSISAGDYEQSREEFIEEARTLARFQHPGIVDVYTVFSENNSAYMVMEYLRGSDLSQIVEERGPIPEAEAISYIRQVGEALEVVHREAMLHRDIKPDNVVIRENGPAVLIDFGLTQKLQTTTGLGTTRLSTNTRFGTAGYAPLEQYSRQAQVGIYTDVYALAATLYHLLTGQAPTEATERAAGVEVPDPRLVNPRLSVATVNALLHGLAMDARQRPQSVQAFLDLLQTPQTLQQSPPPVQRPRPTAEPSSPEPIRIDIPGYTSGPPQRRPQPQQPARRMPEPEPYEEFPDPFQRPPMPIIMPGFGCVRVSGCGFGCLVFIIFIILNMLGAVVTVFS